MRDTDITLYCGPPHCGGTPTFSSCLDQRQNDLNSSQLGPGSDAETWHDLRTKQWIIEGRLEPSRSDIKHSASFRTTPPMSVRRLRQERLLISGPFLRFSVDGSPRFRGSSIAMLYSDEGAPLSIRCEERERALCARLVEF